MNRSVTTPLPRPLAQNSPDFPSNSESPFPRFPNPQSMKPRAGDRLEPTYPQHYAAPSPLFAPLSPRTNAGENISKRLDTIAPGPFDRRPSTASASTPISADASPHGHRRTGTQSSTRSFASMRQQRTSLTSDTSRSSAYSNRSAGMSASPRSGGSRTSPPPLPSTSERSEGIDAFLDRLQKETVESTLGGQNNKIHTESIRPESRNRREPPPRPRRPSERDLPTEGLADFHQRGLVTRSNDTLQARAPSRSGSETDAAKEDGSSQSLRPPPLLTTRLGAESSFNPLHTPSDSGLSDDSYASSGFRSAASSRSSPPGSVASHSREASKLSRSDYVAEESAERTASPERYTDSRPTRSYVRPTGTEGLPRSLSPGYANPPESPMDPAIQMGTSFGRRPSELVPLGDPALMTGRTSPQNSDAMPRQTENRRPKPSSKGKCRGCSEPIIGKSVKDSSGRLTGRYHKECFVCRTCADPFPTAEFYVFENSPLCEHHYHKLNGSLCGACNRGIEGQYLETDMRRKYHPRCFTCTTCRVVLRDGYFDVNGRRYCDRHAQSAAAPPRNHLGPGGYKPRNLQKRGTRLMMMA